MKYILVFIMVVCSTSLFSQKYKYILTVSDNSEFNINKEFSKKLYSIFDQGADFEALTSQFIIESDIDITEEVFLQKMHEAGYTRILFTKQEIINTITE